jgi:putative transposase
MTDVGRMSVQELLGKVLADEHADVLRQAVCWLAEQLMEAEVTAAAGAGYGERSGDRVARRNGYRERAWETRVGSIELAIPRLRSGSYFPSFLEPRRRSEQALVAVVQEAYVNGVSTRKVDRLVEALGLAGISKDTVSRLCRGLDEQVTAFQERPLDGTYPYLWLDAKVEKVRAGGRVEHHALVVAYGVDASGQREVIGLDVGAAETEAFWREFLRSLVRRGLTGVQLVISDAHQGLKAAIAQVLSCPGSAARCTSCATRSAIAQGLQQLVGAAIRPIFRAGSLEDARRLLGETVAHLEARVPKVARLLLEAESDLLTFYHGGNQMG